MPETKTYPANRYNQLLIHIYRLFVQGVFPQQWFRGPIPNEASRGAVSGHFLLGIVSHCWQYSNMLAYQLSSLVNHPPKDLSVTMTVFYAREDVETRKMLDFFSQQKVENVKWDWQILPRKKLFRRAIGRNMIARSTKADWVWFTDCDIIFHENCLDSLAVELQNRRSSLVYPQQERTTPMLAESDPMLKRGRKLQLVEIDADKFSLHSRDKAKGAFQIVHGDIARAIGYCADLFIFQTEAFRWSKTYEDTAFRHMLETNGEPVYVTGVYQIRHIHKGRYEKGTMFSRLRSKIRRVKE